MRQIGNKVSYVKNPFAKNSFYCLGLGIASLLLGALSMYFSVKNAGQGGLNTGAYGFSSMAAAIMGLWYGILSFTEDDCNYILARIGMALEGIILLVWGHHYIYRYLQISDTRIKRANISIKAGRCGCTRREYILWIIEQFTGRKRCRKRTAGPFHGARGSHGRR